VKKLPKIVITKELKKKIIDMYLDPLETSSMRGTAEKLGLTKSTVGRVLKEYKQINGTKIESVPKEKIVPKPITRTKLDISLNEGPPIPKIRATKKTVKIPNYIEFVEFCKVNKEKYPELYSKFYRNRKKWKSLIQDFLTVVSDMADSSK